MQLVRLFCHDVISIHTIIVVAVGQAWFVNADSVALQIGRQGSTGHRQARETLAQLSEWMLNRGLLFPRSAAPAAKAYSASQLRLTWLDAG